MNKCTENSFLAKLRRINPLRWPGCLSEWIDKRIQSLFEFMAEFADGFADSYSPDGKLDPVRYKERMLKRFMANDKRMFGERSLWRTSTLFVLGEFYRQQYRWGDAASYFKLAIDIVLENTEPGERERIARLSRVAEFFKAYCQYETAAGYFRLAVESKEIEFGAVSEELMEDLHGLACVLDKDGRYEEAEQVYLRWFDIAETCWGPTDHRLYNLLSEMARFYRANDREREAEKVDRHCSLLNVVCVTYDALGEEHFLLADDLEELAKYRASCGKSEIVSRLRDWVWMIRMTRRIKGPKYPGLHNDLRALASWYKKRGRGGDGTVAFHLEKRAESLNPTKRKGRDY